MADHEYTGSGLVRADGTVVQSGDVIEPTDAELESFGDTLRPVHGSAESGGESAENAPEDSNGETSDGDGRATDGSHSGESDDDSHLSPAEARELLSAVMDDPDDYRELQSLAADYPDVPGSGISAAELQTLLAEKIQ